MHALPGVHVASSGMLQAQCILFRRYPGVLEPFKYAGYPMLLQAVTIEEASANGDEGVAGPDHWLAPDKVPHLQV